MTETYTQNRRLGCARSAPAGGRLPRGLSCCAAACAAIYWASVTGARADHRELLRLLKAPAPGYVMTVTRSDRAGRSSFDLFGVVKQIVDAKAIGI